MIVVTEKDMTVVKGVLESLMSLGIINLDQYLDVLLGLDRYWREQDIDDYNAKKHVIVISRV